MTHQKPPFDPPAGPTPEEISARLEALLKRTHELRRAQAKRRTDGPPDEGPTWPPSDRDMAAVEVLDVPASRSGGPLFTPPLAGAAPSAQEDTPHAEAATRPQPMDERPDWSTLRLRDAPPDAPAIKTPRWVWPVLVVLVVALAAESAYLVWTAPWAVAPVSAVTAAPVDSRVEPAAVPPAAEPPAAAPAEPPQPSAASAAQPAIPTPSGTPDAVAATSATTGAVLIESDPPGAVVTMEGRERGVTPLTIGRLRPGRHDVTVVRPGLGRLDLKVDVEAGRTTRLDASGRPPAQR